MGTREKDLEEEEEELGVVCDRWGCIVFKRPW